MLLKFKIEITNSIKTLCLTIVMLSLISSCIPSSYTRYYLYKGAPRSPKDVAIFVTHQHTLLLYLNDSPMGKRLQVFDLLAGEYKLKFIYFKTGAVNWSTGDPVSINLSSKAGHIYYFYPIFLKNKKMASWYIRFYEC